MRRIVAMLGSWAVGLGLAGLIFAQAPMPRANPAARPRPGGAPARPALAKARRADDPATIARTNTLLDEWQAKCTGIKTLDAKFKRTDTSVVWGDKTYFEGRALLKAPNLACLDVQRLDRGKKSFEERIICTGEEIWQYVGQGTQSFVFPLGADAQNAALQQGPLPFLFDMNAEKLKERYELILDKMDEKDYHVRITPRLAIDQKNFELAILSLNKKTLLPDRLVMKANNGDTQDYLFVSVARNAPVSDRNFEGKPWPGFKVVRNPNRDLQPRPNNPPAVGVRPRGRGR